MTLHDFYADEPELFESIAEVLRDPRTMSNTSLARFLLDLAQREADLASKFMIPNCEDNAIRLREAAQRLHVTPDSVTR